jgi:alpha-D-ribose 1-methylphosphonate 5-triphosphate diphosphatase
VLADRVMEDATVVVEDGRIASVRERGAAPADAVDGRGAFCLPGLVDIHSDGLEKEAEPRRGVTFPADFALASFEGRVRAAGVTTVFHGVAFEDNADMSRSVERAERCCEAIGARRRSGAPLVDHRVLHRLDARDPGGLASLRRILADSAEPVPLVSFEDHTPGQGQYADTDAYRSFLERTQNLGRSEAQAEVDAWRVRRDAQRSHRDTAIDWMTAEVEAGRFRLLAHDPADAADVAEATKWGAAVAEFPTSRAAAAAAQDAGMPTVMGSPNVLRGGSHSGNVAAEELVALGLCTALASDYLPSTLLAAAFRLAEAGCVSLPEAVALVTSGPAQVAGLDDRGTLSDGHRADLVLTTLDRGWPTVRLVLGGS